MFYSHEVLTSRKHGVATVWLVATLGSKSTLKRVSRKAILDVDVQKACGTIIKPDAPMALRLQSNLLYGVARVYSQQCGYVLADAETAKNNMRAMFKALHSSGLEPEGQHKGRADQLILPDDPNFLLDLNLLPLDPDQLNLDLSANAEESQRSTLSPYNSQLTTGSRQTLPGIELPGRSSSLIGGPVGGVGSSLSIRGDSGTGRRAPMPLEDDLDLVIDADGTMHFSDRPVRQSAGAVSAGSGRGGLADGTQIADMPAGLDDDGFMPIADDDFQLGLDAQPFPGRADDDTRNHVVSSETVTAEAPARQRKKPEAKVLMPDSTMELRNGDLARWNTDYVANMREAMRQKQAARALSIAKENAKVWVLGAADFGALSQSDTLMRGPLGMFSGVKLIEALTGLDLLGAGGKRSRDAGDVGEQGARKRSRHQEPSSDEQGRGMLMNDDGYIPMVGDDYTGVEQGREAPTPLDDRRISSLFPWNQSTGSRCPTGHFTSASPSGAVQLAPLSRRGSKLLSASPLMGRGLPGAASEDLPQTLYSDQIGGEDVLMTGLDDFELYGPAAQVDTQTAAESQWQRSALDGESVNFLGFVQAAILEADNSRDEARPGEEEDDMLRGSVDFETLLPPETNTRVVAAQGLLHVLALGTKNMLKVEQEEAFGPITVRDISI